MSKCTNVSVRLKEHSYHITIGHRCLPSLGGMIKKLHIGRDAVVMTDRSILRCHGRHLTAALKKAGMSVKIFEVPSGEKSKSADKAFDLVNKIARYDVHRQIFLVAFGGGVIGDLAGFVAAVYRRGIPYVQVPTTFLGQIDSAIGGKVGVDLSAGKNLMGAFYQPKLVLTDTALLATLPLREMKNGLAEAVKYGVIRDRRLFEYIEKNYEKILSLHPQAVTKVVTACSKIKAGVVQRDEKETSGLRMILNFGHTAGHAIEAASGYRLAHGEAVAVGMRIAADISRRQKLLSKKNQKRIEDLLTNIRLPSSVKNIPLKKVLSIMQHDKKFKGARNRFVLAGTIGRVKIVTDIPPAVIKQAVKKCLR